MFSEKDFFELEKKLIDANLDSDMESFDCIKSNLQNPKILSPDLFARTCIYVILASGFSQKTAKKKHLEIMNYIEKTGVLNDNAGLLNIFNNQNKTNAIVKIWNNRIRYRDGYYDCNDLQTRLFYVQKLPHIGKITSNHLLRNLGENLVKYDIWIQRLGVLFSGDEKLVKKINNGNLDVDVKRVVDDMFCHFENVTKLPRGYIDVVLWRACQNGLIKL